ncbi:MAG TPA: hypothetical protein VMH85_13025 [Terriglobales bacterium]|nr:hypothetical protein [Terriglobales bacterium]
MKALSTKLFLGLGVLICGLGLVTSASAECGSIKLPATLHPQSWQGGNLGASLLLASDHEDGIVGMWKADWTAKGNAGIPDGTPIDSPFIVFHADKTEIMNSSRPPQDGNFCMGVWERVGRNKYKVNHFAMGPNDAAGDPPYTHITETVWLGPDGKTYWGNFTLDVYDASGNQLAEILGTITATRVTVDTPYNIFLQ